VRESRYKDMTGMIPLYVKITCSYGLEDADDAIRKFLYDYGPCAGKWIRTAIYEYSIETIKQGKKDEYIKVMTAAIGGLNFDNFASIYSHRFFFIKNDKLEPTCGVVRFFTAVVLKNDLLGNLTEGWVMKVWDSNQTNPSMKGFAFEMYGLAFMSRNFHDILRQNLLNAPQVKPAIQIIYFEGDYPLLRDLNVQPGTCVLFWPIKWNLRSIDAVLRWVFPDGAIHIIYIQLTLNNPSTHTKSLRIYTDIHDGKTDSQRYEAATDGDSVNHMMLWLLPSTASVLHLPELLVHKEAADALKELAEKSNAAFKAVDDAIAHLKESARGRLVTIIPHLIEALRVMSLSLIHLEPKLTALTRAGFIPTSAADSLRATAFIESALSKFQEIENKMPDVQSSAEKLRRFYNDKKLIHDSAVTEVEKALALVEPSQCVHTINVN